MWTLVKLRDPGCLRYPLHSVDWWSNFYRLHYYLQLEVASAPPNAHCLHLYGWGMHELQRYHSSDQPCGVDLLLRYGADIRMDSLMGPIHEWSFVYYAVFSQHSLLIEWTLLLGILIDFLDAQHVLMCRPDSHDLKPFYASSKPCKMVLLDFECRAHLNDHDYHLRRLDN